MGYILCVFVYIYVSNTKTNRNVCQLNFEQTFFVQPSASKKKVNKGHMKM